MNRQECKRLPCWYTEAYNLRWRFVNYFPFFAAIDLYLYMTCIYSLTGIVLQYVSWVNVEQRVFTIESPPVAHLHLNTRYYGVHVSFRIVWNEAYLFWVTKSASPTPSVGPNLWIRVAEGSRSVCRCVWINRLGPPLAPATALQSHFGNSLYGVRSW